MASSGENAAGDAHNARRRKHEDEETGASKRHCTDANKTPPTQQRKLVAPDAPRRSLRPPSTSSSSSSTKDLRSDFQVAELKSKLAAAQEQNLKWSQAAQATIALQRQTNQRFLDDAMCTVCLQVSNFPMRMGCRHVICDECALALCGNQGIRYRRPQEDPRQWDIACHDYEPKNIAVFGACCPTCKRGFVDLMGTTFSTESHASYIQLHAAIMANGIYVVLPPVPIAVPEKATKIQILQREAAAHAAKLLSKQNQQPHSVRSTCLYCKCSATIFGDYTGLVKHQFQCPKREFTCGLGYEWRGGRVGCGKKWTWEKQYSSKRPNTSADWCELATKAMREHANICNAAYPCTACIDVHGDCPGAYTTVKNILHHAQNHREYDQQMLKLNRHLWTLADIHDHQHNPHEGSSTMLLSRDNLAELGRLNLMMAAFVQEFKALFNYAPLPEPVPHKLSPPTELLPEPIPIAPPTPIVIPSDEMLDEMLTQVEVARQQALEVAAQVTITVQNSMAGRADEARVVTLARN